MVVYNIKIVIRKKLKGLLKYLNMIVNIEHFYTEYIINESFIDAYTKPDYVNNITEEISKYILTNVYMPENYKTDNYVHDVTILAYKPKFIVNKQLEDIFNSNTYINSKTFIESTIKKHNNNTLDMSGMTEIHLKTLLNKLEDYEEYELMSKVKNQLDKKNTI